MLCETNKTYKTMNNKERNLPLTTPMLAQESYSEIPEKTDQEINIISAESITLSPDSVIVLPGESRKIEVASEPFISGTPTETLVWESSDSSIARVEGKGIVIGVSKGSAKITATDANDNKITASINVRVTDVMPGSVEMNPASKEVVKKGTFKITATPKPEGTGVEELVWSSESESIATVDQSGNVTAVEVGETNIVATVKGTTVSGKCAVTVTPILVSGITVDPTSKSVTEGEEFTITPTIAPEDANNKVLHWESNHPEFAEVDQEGNVTAVAEGEATITVSSTDGSEQSATCTVTVSPRE